MPKEMLINIVEGEECRIALLEGGVLQELYTERASTGSQVGNIYKGRVTNVEPSIQAAFVDYGAPKHGFLHISDVLPEHFPSGRSGTERVGRKVARKDRPPIQECLRRGQEVICQITKEGIGTKGPTLTTYLSVPGRFVVMMPGMTRNGVSRRIEDEEERQKLRKQLEEIDPPPNMGFIIRTAGMGRPKRDLQHDLNYLLRLWRSVDKRIKTAKAPAELYRESDLVIRTIRDIYTSEISCIVCDSEKTARNIAEFLKVVMPRGKNVVKAYKGDTPLFHHYGLEHELEKIYARRVELATGGSLVIDQTEALVAIDVNSGRNRKSSDAEETAFRANIAAAKEIARQLRLRDMGGVIVIDFIDMRYDRHQREVERVLREAVKPDRARSKMLKLSRFGVIEMTRQRVRPSLKSSIYRDCPFCNATGLIKSDESLALALMRDLQLACADEQIATIVLSVSTSAAEYINNRRRRQLARLEADTGKVITVQADPALAGDDLVFQFTDARGSAIPWQPDHDKDAGASSTAPGKTATKPVDDELIDVSDLPPLALDEAPAEEAAEAEGLGLETADAAAAEEAEVVKPESKRRRRGRRKSKRAKVAAGTATQPAAEEPAVSATEAPAETVPAHQAPAEPAGEPASPAVTAETSPEEPAPAKKKRHRSGRKHRRKKTVAQADDGTAAAVEAKPPPPSAESPPAVTAETAGEVKAAGDKRPARKAPKKRTRRPRKKASVDTSSENG